MIAGPRPPLMGLRDRFDAIADRVAAVASSVLVTAPDHPGSGGITGDDDPPSDEGDAALEEAGDRSEDTQPR